MEEKSIAYELLQEVKKTNKRLFILAIVELTIIVSMITGFLIYLNQYEYATTTEETYTQESEYSSDVNQVIKE